MPKKKTEVGATQQVNTQQQTQTQTTVESTVETAVSAQQEDTLTGKGSGLSTKTSEWQVPWAEGNFFSEEFFFNPKNGEKVGYEIATLRDYVDAISSKIEGVKSPKTFFSSAISMTGNYRTGIGWAGLKEQDKLFTPFGAGTKPASVSLLIKNKATGKTYMRYLAPDEAAHVWGLLDADQKGVKPKDWPAFKKADWDQIFSKENRTCQVALFSPTIGIIQEGSDPMNPESLANDEEMIALTTETKFWNGTLDYTKEEIDYLKTWIQRVGADDFENMLLKNILRYRPHAQAAYPHSVIAALIAEHSATNAVK